MTAVLVFGDIPSTGHVPRTGTERVLVGSAEGAVPTDAVIDLVRHRLDVTGYVLALYPAWHPEAGLRTLRLVHASLNTERFALVPCHLPPLAFSLVADQIGYLAPYMPPGGLIGLVSSLSRVTLAGAWVRSVAGLEHIPASLSDHFASYVPGGGFMVTASPAMRLHRVTKGAPLDELAYRPSDPVHLLTTSGEGADTEWLQESLMPAVGAAHVRPVAPPPLGETYWGTKKYLEFVAFSAHPKALSVIANSVRCRPCPWCGEPVATSTCPLCSMVAVQGPAPQGPAAQPPPQRQDATRTETANGPARPGQQPAPQQPPPPPPDHPQQPGPSGPRSPAGPQQPGRSRQQQAPPQQAPPQQSAPGRPPPPPPPERANPDAPAQHRPLSQEPSPPESPPQGRRRAPGPPDQGGATGATGATGAPQQQQANSAQQHRDSSEERAFVSPLHPPHDPHDHRARRTTEAEPSPRSPTRNGAL